MQMNVPTILTPRQWTTFDRMKARMFAGRKRGTTGGSLVADLVALEKALVLCGECQGKFDWRRQQYYSVGRYEHRNVLGQCDVCRTEIVGNDGRLFLHEAQRPKVWATPDEQRQRAATKRRVAATQHARRS